MKCCEIEQTTPYCGMCGLPIEHHPLLGLLAMCKGLGGAGSTNRDARRWARRGEELEELMQKAGLSVPS
jgi:hypothetical protein